MSKYEREQGKRLTRVIMFFLAINFAAFNIDIAKNTNYLMFSLVFSMGLMLGWLYEALYNEKVMG